MTPYFSGCALVLLTGILVVIGALLYAGTMFVVAFPR
jgi:hypothetical protein